MSLIEALNKNPFIMAPMAGITDHAFRSFMKARGSSIVVTELVSASGIEHKSERTLKLMSFDETQRPIGIQLFGEEPEIVARAAQLVEEMGADFVDLNFGCPVPKVVKKGAGSAILKDLPALTKMLSTVKAAVKIPVTIKIRTGWDASSRNAIEVTNIAYNEGITWVAVHGRTRAQSYSGFADWDYIREIKAASKLPIIGNGDILTAQQAVNRLNESGCDGVMIGRGCLKNPYIFRDALALWQGQDQTNLKPDYALLFQELNGVFTTHCEEHIRQIQLKKFAAWFATGYAGAAQFRKNLFQSKDTNEILNNSYEFFSGINNSKQEDTSNDGFLMGGHG